MQATPEYVLIIRSNREELMKEESQRSGRINTGQMIKGGVRVQVVEHAYFVDELGWTASLIFSEAASAQMFYGKKIPSDHLAYLVCNCRTGKATRVG